MTIARALPLLAAPLLSMLAGAPAEAAETAATHPYAGMWVTADGRIRHHLLPNGRYEEARGGRECAYKGRYAVAGSHIEYWDDTGFTADGDFIDGVLHHGGMVLHRQRETPPARGC
ncbi:Atu4866 domain-containing protein [Teichococcus aestuarii]|uniref:Agrobacterium tumefaciens protein Atu4866 n=1 Tax=Teichococcus aestuarii TaxID=568898 RepID=A0A2U1V5E5_9PROT|nr:Atu4866 domain-containing protein [Pseudoroseomonas aestuarii]PWC29103.1 hypothetical protein CR165_07860 [Pseudoroseomonas aestuarii]